jgi:hypothetical protein
MRDRKSLRGQRQEGERRRKESEQASQTIQRTEVDAVKVADQVGAIDSGLSDVNEQIREARNRVLDSATKAGAEDAAAVKRQEDAAQEQRGSVADAEQHVRSEKGKADRVRPADSRIQDGSDLAKTLEEASRALGDIGKDLEATRARAAEQRKKSERAIDGAVKRNRK